ncbi:MAG: glycosyltransferase [Patescibacteria group bacterium]
MITVGILTDTTGASFQRLISSIPASCTHLCIVDNTNDPKAQLVWKQLEKKLQVEIIDHPTAITSFSEARNQVITQCQTEWLLFLDSDEVFTASEQDVSRIIEQADLEGAAAISLNRSDVFHGKTLQYGEAGRQKIIRLFRPSKTTYTGATHEVLIVNGSVLSSSLVIKHHAHQDSSAFISAVSEYASRVSLEKSTGFWRNSIEIFCFPLGKFVYNLLFKLGVKDGWRGVTYASCMSLHSLLVRIYRYEHFLAKK